VQIPSEETDTGRHSPLYTNIPCFATILVVVKPEESTKQEKAHLKNRIWQYMFQPKLKLN